MKNVKNNIEQQKRDNEAWYDRRYNEDATQRADAQRVISMLNEQMKQRNRNAEGAGAVMGATDSSVAQQKADNNDIVANTAANIAIAGDKRKDAIESDYQNRDASLDGQLNSLEVGRAQAISQAVQGAATATAELGTSIDDYYNNKK
ncbi:MAG: hypothetical protein ACI4XS_07475 [Bacillus sp. (in: firmicutes)]